MGALVATKMEAIFLLLNPILVTRLQKNAVNPKRGKETCAVMIINSESTNSSAVILTVEVV